MAEPQSNDHKYLSDEEIAELAKTLRVADPTKDNGAFSSVTRLDALVWLRLMGANNLDSNSPLTDEDVLEKLKFALWDSQRLDYFFPGATLSGSQRKLKIGDFESWNGWKKEHAELRNARGLQQLDGYRDAKRLNSYVFRHFTLSVWSQAEVIQGLNMRPSKDISGAWHGARSIMSNAALDITRDGGDKIPFVSYFDNDSQNILIIEILDVKACPWLEPGKKMMELIRTCQETKFGHPASGPLVPMMQTPTFPLIIVRYSYMEGRPEGGSQLLSHLQERLAKSMPKNTTMSKIREKLQWHLRTGEEMPSTHLKMLARILSFNSDLVDRDFQEEAQSHWNGISEEVAAQSRISFIVPCLKLRFRALEHIETGISLHREEFCAACKKPTESKLMCGVCKSVYYCNAECNKANWEAHKNECRFSKYLFQASSPNLDPKKAYACTRTFLDFILDSGYAVEQESIRLSGLAPIGDCPPNEYGTERFIVKLHRPPDYTVNGMAKGLTVFIYDRRRSMQLRSGPGDPIFARNMKLGKPIPFDSKGHEKVIKLIVQKGLLGQVIYVWAKRIGDCIEIDLEDIPRQTFSW